MDPAFKAVYSLISPNIKANNAEPGTYGIPCSQVSSLPAEIGFTFTSQSGKAFTLTIPSSELSVGPFESNPSLCQTLINADSYTIIGASLLKHYYSVWDVGGQRMGFASNGEFLECLGIDLLLMASRQAYKPRQSLPLFLPVKTPGCKIMGMDLICRTHTVRMRGSSLRKAVHLCIIINSMLTPLHHLHPSAGHPQILRKGYVLLSLAFTMARFCD